MTNNVIQEFATLRDEHLADYGFAADLVAGMKLYDVQHLKHSELLRQQQLLLNVLPAEFSSEAVPVYTPALGQTALELYMLETQLAVTNQTLTDIEVLANPHSLSQYIGRLATLTSCDPDQ